MSARWALLLAWCLSGCGSAPAAIDAPGARSNRAPFPRLAAPGRFSPYPICLDRHCEWSARIDTGKEGCLHLTTRGERWLSLRCGEHPTRAAADRAPVRLVGFGKLGPHAVFAGADGTLHLAETPLGDFVSHVPAPAPGIVTATAGEGFALAFGAKAAFRYQVDTAWRTVDAPGPHVRSSAARGEHVLLLQSPERLLHSEDAGKSFAPLVTPNRGVTRLHAWDDAILAPGLVSEAIVRPGGVVEERPGDFDARFESDRRLFPRRTTHDEGALVVGAKGVFAIAKTGSKTVLLSGPLEGPYGSERLPDLDDCESFALAAHEPDLALGCVARDRVRVYLREGGSAPLRIAVLATTLEARVGLALSSTGQVLATGVCPANEAACPGSLAVLVKGAPPRFAAPGTVAAAPGSFSWDGTRAYALGSTLEGKAALFVGKGDRFDARLLVPVPVDGDADDSGAHAPPAAAVVDADSRLGVGEDGELGIGVGMSEHAGRAWVTADADGNSQRASFTSMSAPAGYGRRVVRLQLEERDDVVRVDESDDGGRSWAPIHVGEKSLLSALDDLTCGRAGCVLTPIGVRVGWGLAELPVAEEKKAPHRHAISGMAPIACSPAPNKKWVPIHATDLPLPRSTAIGDVLWSTVQYVPDVRMTVLRVDAKGRSHLEHKVLFPKLPDGAFAVPHAEPDGWVVTRFRSREAPEVRCEHLRARTSLKRTLAAAPDAWSLLPDGGCVLGRGDGQVVVFGPTGKKENRRLADVAQVTSFEIGLVRGVPFALGVLRSSWRGLLAATANDRVTGLAGEGEFDMVGWSRTVRLGTDTAVVVPFGQGAGVELWAARLRADGGIDPLEELPNVAKLGQLPRGCSAAERATTPRVVHETHYNEREKPWYRWVDVSGPAVDGVEMPGWLAGDIVVQGSPSSPCLASVTGQDHHESAVIVDGEGTSGWLVQAEGPRHLRPSRALPLVCKVDPTLPLPPQAYGR